MTSSISTPAPPFRVPTTTQVENVFAELTRVGDLQTYHSGLLTLSGLRLHEAVRLRWADLDFDKGTITVVMPKARLPRVVPMTDRVRRELRGHYPEVEDDAYVFMPEYERVRVETRLRHSLNKAARRLKVHLTFHLLRRKCACDLANSGVSMCELTRALGYACVRRADCFLAYCRAR